LTIKFKSQAACAFQVTCKHSELKHTTFPMLWVLQRFQTAKVTFNITQGHWQSCYSIGHTWFPISLPVQLSLYLAPFPRYRLFPKI